ncbi:MAG: hypothetical protein ABS76_22705 [Pelagibacterium sp. SCN 64-44]|nr:MAG: hypothetical protein ABS76_22705 [Pelagibacterium sp. SCN 64-44]
MSEMLHYEADGEGGGPTLLLIHAMGADLSFWRACRAIWAGRFRCIAVDLRGSGGSVSAARPVTVMDHVQDLTRLTETLAPGPHIPIGCAIGGTVAAAYGAHNAERCAGLVMSNPSIATGGSAREALAQRARAVRDGGMDACMPGAVDGAFKGDDDLARRAEYTSRFAAQDPVSYANVVEGILDLDIRALAQTIALPTLIVSGDNDILLPPGEHAAPLHAAIAGSELVMLPGAAHFIPYQRPAAFAGLVIDFIERRCAPRP